MLDPQTASMFSAFVDRISEIEQHIGILNDHSGVLTTQLAVIGERVEWLCFFFKTFVVAFIGMLATQIWQIVLMKKKK